MSATLTQPSNNSELQLYRVLQRANLLQYFETFITQGGDDVQQLCEAGEDEFLEIMALVGMASKPLHVRRLQKALQEWVANPAAFEAMKKFPTHVMSMTGTSPSHSMNTSNGMTQDYKVTPPQSSTISTSTPWASNRGGSPSESSNLEHLSEHPSPTDSPHEDFKDMMFPGDVYSSVMTSLSPPSLLDHQITAIATAAGLLAQDLPPFEPKSLPKKQVSKEIQAVMMMSHDDQLRMDALRKYAAIYGRFDSKRKNDKPMSLHEISVNEAAAQLCSHFPALLTRREELFPLARQVVRDSGYQYSKGHSRAAEVVPVTTPKTEPPDPVSTSPSTSTSSRAYVMSTSPSISPSNRGYAVITPPSTSTSQRGGYTKSTSPSASLRGYDKNLNDLQTELSEITLSLSELTKEQDRIRSALRVLLENNDHNQTRALTAEMDVLNDQQTALTKRRQTLVNTIAKHKKNSSKYSTHGPSVRYPVPIQSGSNQMMNTYGRSSSTKQSYSGNKSQHRHNNMENNIYGAGYSDQNSSNSLNTLYMGATAAPISKDSLYEEGLRIATQYGMADFAQELIGMKSQEKPVNSDLSKLETVSRSETCTLTVPKPISVLMTGSLTSGGDYASHTTTASQSTSHKTAGHSSTNSSTVAMITGQRLSAGPAFVTTPPVSEISHSPETRDHTHNKDQSRKEACDFLGNSPSCSIYSDTDSKSSSQMGEVSLSVLPPLEGQQEDQEVKGKETAAGSTTTTTTITTKTGQVIAVETRRSSRKRNGEPDYYLINGGEKRFRPSGRRSSSTSSERAARLSSSLIPSPITSPSRGKNEEIFTDLRSGAAGYKPDCLNDLDPREVYVVSQDQGQGNMNSDKHSGRKRSKLFFHDINRNTEMI